MPVPPRHKLPYVHFPLSFAGELDTLLPEATVSPEQSLRILSLYWAQADWGWCVTPKR